MVELILFFYVTIKPIPDKEKQKHASLSRSNTTMWNTFLPGEILHCCELHLNVLAEFYNVVEM